MKPSTEVVVGKVVYLVSKSASDALAADHHRELKVVAAGMKAFERKVGSDRSIEYRLLQEGIHLLAPYISKRKVEVTIQDFCNLLEAGQVSLSSMSPTTVTRIIQQPPGILVLVYRFRREDVLRKSVDEASKEQTKPEKDHMFYILCWKGNGFAVNVTCKKIGNHFNEFCDDRC